MTVSLIILSRHDDDGRPIRSAQLDLLIRSINRNTSARLSSVASEPAGARFDARIHAEIDGRGDPLVAFVTDDCVFYRPVPDTIGAWMKDREVLCFSLRLGANVDTCYPTGEHVSEWPGPEWRWQGAPGDFGYPGSVDGHVFRRSDLREMLDGVYLDNPTALEVILNDRCASLGRPLMCSGPVSSLVSVPVNRVSSQSGVRHGETYPADASYLNEMFQHGARIDLERTFAGVEVRGAHQEVEYEWVS